MSPFAKALWSRWVLVAAVVVMAAALFLTVWVTYRGVDDASEALLRGQAAALQADLREEFRELRGAAGQEELQAIYDVYASQGLTYIAVAEGGRPVRSVGATGLSAGELADSISSARRGQVRIDGDVVRLFLRARGERAVRGKRGKGRRTPPPIYVEFVPQEAKALRASSRRSLAIGATASVLLIVLAGLMGRLFSRQERMRALEERDRRLKGLGEMSAVLAHEIRNPLTSLKGNAQLLEAMLSKQPEQNGKVVSKAQRVVSEATRLEDLITDLLDFARSGELRREARDPGQLLLDSANLVSATGIKVDVSRAPKRFSLDAGRMQQVLCNLLQNAVETGAAVEASASLAGKALVYRVRDHGPGIDSSQLDLLFEPFHTKKTHGTGLGLAVAKRLVELHGGSITARNAVGGGAEFVVEIPAASA